MSVRILVGDVFERLAELPPESIDCVVTSPPYWGLRDYGVDGQIGLEPTFGDHLAVLVRLFREVRRVMTRRATLWLNYGDCYASTPNGRSAAATKAAGTDDRTFRDKPVSTIGGTFKPKDLLMMPNRLAIALQDDGWWVRSEIIWGKPNPMPDSSGRFRPSTAHEKIFLLTKSASAHYDPAAVRLAMADSSLDRLAQDVDAQAGSVRANGGVRADRPMKAVGGDKQRGHSRRHAGFNDRWDAMTKDEQQANGRLLRNYEDDLSALVPPAVWRIACASFSDAHFATFPPALVVPCILAGCPAGGTVLDPFGGAGTTALVADALGRDAILIELNPAYADIAARRVAAAAPLLTAVELSAAPIGRVREQEVML